MLDGITDPHNLGACLRVANAAGAHAVIAPKDHAAGINATVSKVASGAAEITPYFMVTNLARTLADLKDRNIWIVGIGRARRKDAFRGGPARFHRLGAGRRRRGHAPPDARELRPAGEDPDAAAQVESLNASVAAGICLFESVRRRRTLTPRRRI